jgi:hypothetical protein
MPAGRPRAARGVPRTPRRRLRVADSRTSPGIARKKNDREATSSCGPPSAPCPARSAVSGPRAWSPHLPHVADENATSVDAPTPDMLPRYYTYHRPLRVAPESLRTREMTPRTPHAARGSAVASMRSLRTPAGMGGFEVRRESAVFGHSSAANRLQATVPLRRTQRRFLLRHRQVELRLEGVESGPPACP